MTPARRGLLMSVVLGVVVAVAYAVFVAAGSAGAVRHRRSAGASRSVILRASKHRLTGRAGTPTIHLRGFRDFDLGPDRLGAGNRSHGNQELLTSLRKLPGTAGIVGPRRSRTVRRLRGLKRMRLVPSLRTAESDTFESSSGVYEVRVYTRAVNYKAANGRFEPINDRLRRSGRVLVDRADSDRLELPLRLNRPVSISDAGSTLRLRPLGASSAARARVSGKIASYAHAYPGASMSLKAVPGSLELSFSLANPRAQRVFELALGVPRGWHAWLRHGGLFVADRRGAVRFRIPVPMMLEHSGHAFVPSYAGAHRIGVSLSRRAGRLTLSYSINRSWLSRQSHHFPVVLDPSVTPSDSLGADCTIYSNLPSSTADCGSSTDDLIGAGESTGGAPFGSNPTSGTYVTMMNFNAAAAGIPADDEVLGATLSLNVTAFEPAGSTVSYAALPMTDSFTPDEGSWNYASVTGSGASQVQQPWQCPGGDYVGCQSGTPTTIAGTGQLTQTGTFTASQPTTNTVSLTALVQAWVDGSQPGWEYQSQEYWPLMLYPTSTGSYAEIASFANTSNSPPALNIYYAPRLGNDPGATIPVTSVDNSTSVGINVANGDVQAQQSDLNVAGTAGMNLDLGHSYNSNAANGGWNLDQPPSLNPVTNGLSSVADVTDAMVLTGSDGNQSVWDAAPTSTWGEGGIYTPPPGVNGSLCEALPNGNPATAVGYDNEPYVFWVGANGQLQGEYANFNSATGTNSWVPITPESGTGAPTPISTAAPNSSPAVVVVTPPGSTSYTQDQIHLWYIDSNHAIAQWYYTGIDGWVDAQLNSSVAPNTSPAVGNDSSRDEFVYFHDTNNKISEWAWNNSAHSWTPTELTSTDVAPNSSPAVTVEPSSGYRHVFYVDDSSGTNQIEQAYWNGSWIYQPLGGLPPAPNTSPSVAIDANLDQFVLYTDINANENNTTNVAEWAYYNPQYTPSGTWTNLEPSSNGTTGAAVAPDSSPTVTVGSLSSTAVPFVYYTGSDDHFAQLSLTTNAYPGVVTASDWVQQDPLSVAVAPNTSPSAAVFSPSGGTLDPFYIGSDAQIHQMQWDGTLWNDTALGVSAGVSSCKPKNTNATWELIYYDSGQRLDFNAAGQLIAAYDRNGNVIRYSYTSGQLTTITDTQGRTYGYTYPSGQEKITDNAGGRSVTLNLNTSSQVTSDTDAAGNQTNYTYNSSGKLATITDPNTVHTPGDDGTTTISYPAAPTGALWQVNIQRPAPTAPGSYVTTTYTSYPQTTPPPAGLQTCGGSPSGELPYGYTVVTLPDGNWREYCYDTHDRVYGTFDEVTKQPTLTTYDANDDITGVVAPTNTEFGSPTLVTSDSYDACFRPIAQTTGTGANAPTYTESYTKPAATSCAASSPNDYLPSTATPPAGSKSARTTVHYVYDGNGNIKSESDGLSSQNTLSFDYYANGLMKDSYNADGHATTYAYTWGVGSWPAVLASTTVTPPAPQAASTTSYDVLGRVASSTDGNGNTIKIPASGGYDNDNNVLLEQYFNSTGTQTGSTTNTYDNNGNLLQAADTQSGETGSTCYSYWANNQLNTEKAPLAPGQTGPATCNAQPATSTSYTYNNNGDMTGLNDGGGTVTYGYDQNDRVSSITQPGTSTPFTFTYDNDGRLVCTTYPNGMVTEQVYDAYNNLTRIQTANGSSPSCNPGSATGTPNGTVFQDNAYTYAAGSDLAQSQTITAGGTSTAWNYYYDPLNRLLEASSGTAGTYNYSYDGDGNLLTRTTNPTSGAIQTAAYNNDNELCWVYAGSSVNPCGTAPTGSYSATYDSAGNMQTLGSAAGTTTLAYNDQEQTNSINPFAAGAQTLSYRGHGQNHPLQIGNQPSGGGAPGLEEDTLGISAQFPSSSSGSTPSSSYTYYTRAPDGTLLAERGSGGATSTADYYYVQDANDSVVALTNSSDTVANTYTYDPFGTTTASTGTAPNSFGFDGGYDAQGGLILFGTRYYDPALGMWTQPDPAAQSLVADPTQADAYSFAGDDPVNNVDLSGDKSKKEKAKEAVKKGFATGLAIGVAGLSHPDDGFPDLTPETRPLGSPPAQIYKPGGHSKSDDGTAKAVAAGAGVGVLIWWGAKLLSPACGPFAPLCAVFG